MLYLASLIAQLVKNPPAMQETLVQFLGWKDPLEKGQDTHSRVLAWRVPWTVQSLGSPRVGTTERLSLTCAVFMCPPGFEVVTGSSLSLWLHWVLVVAHGIFPCGTVVSL